MCGLGGAKAGPLSGWLFCAIIGKMCRLSSAGRATVL